MSRFKENLLLRMCNQDLMQYLQDLGYHTSFTVEDHDTIITNQQGLAVSVNSCNSNDDQYSTESYHDCGTDEYLFRALAALSDETDNHQFFVRESELHLTNQDIHAYLGDLILCLVDRFNYYEGEPIFNPEVAHKATKSELIEKKDQLQVFYNKLCTH